MPKTYYIYMLECINGAYYTGYTTDITRRYKEHCDRSGKCNYTRAFPPIKIAACWSLQDKTASAALQIERKIKQLSRSAKEKLVQDPSSLTSMLDGKCGSKVIIAGLSRSRE